MPIVIGWIRKGVIDDAIREGLIAVRERDLERLERPRRGSNSSPGWCGSGPVGEAATDSDSGTHSAGEAVVGQRRVDAGDA
jgi:hypothetical protein